MHPRSLAFPFLLFVFAAVLAATAADAPAPPLSADSPFLPPADAPGARPEQPPTAYALVGMTAVGKDTLLSITRQSDKRSFWIPVGKTVNDITVVSYDAATDQAVIRAGGQSFTLVLRKADAVAHPATAPAPMATPVAPAPTLAAAPVSPTTAPPPPGVVANRPMTVQEEKEMEARMLVTDLLEIGQQQRKAYEEAQRQAAARAKSAPPPAANSTPVRPSAPPAPPPAK